jgi:membrane protein DedA with SNARE-associated domain
MEHLHAALNNLMMNYGNIGVFIAMFLESSVFPIPSEIVIIGAGALGVSLTPLMIFGSLGSACGAVVGYVIGRYAGLPFVLKFSKYIFIKPEHIEKAEIFAKKYGPIGVLIGRLLPIIPFKVFSLASGLTRIPFVPFFIYTCIGIAPRILVLALFGQAAVKYSKIVGLICLVLLLCFIIYKFFIQKKIQQEDKSCA